MSRLTELRLFDCLVTINIPRLTALQLALGARTSRPHHLRSTDDDVHRSFALRAQCGQDARAPIMSVSS
jgi:hypothetical protein